MIGPNTLIVKVHESTVADCALPTGRGHPAAPAALKQRPRVDPGPRPSRKMKSFFWDKLPENRLQGTFWQDRSPPYSALHVEEVCSSQHVTCTRCNGKRQACLMPNNHCKLLHFLFDIPHAQGEVHPADDHSVLGHQSDSSASTFQSAPSTFAALFMLRLDTRYIECGCVITLLA